MVRQKMASVVRSQKENELKFLKFYNENYFRIIINSTDVTQTSYPNELISVTILTHLSTAIILISDLANDSGILQS